MKIVSRQLSAQLKEHQEKEWIPANNSDGFRLRFEDASQWLNQAARAIAHALIESSDPFVWQKRDRNGNTWWIIDDPLTGTRFHALSEEEVRAWIEQHYYIQPNSSPNSARNGSPRITGW